MDEQTFLPKNESNEVTEQNLNQQPTTPTPVLYNNQNIMNKFLLMLLILKQTNLN